MNFSNRITTWTESGRTKLFEYLKGFGNPTDIIKYVDKMQIKFCNGSIELAIDQNFFVLKNKKIFYIYPTTMLKYCYFSIDTQEGWVCAWRSHTIGIILSDDKVIEYTVKNKKELETNALILREFIKGFDYVSPSYQEYEVDGFRGKIKINAQHLLVVSKKTSLFKKDSSERTILQIEPIANIIWCEQFHDLPSESSDTFGLKLYLIDGKTITIDIGEIENSYQKSRKAVFELALYLKSNVPHLLYGINSEYKRIFKENPANLLEIANQNSYK